MFTSRSLLAATLSAVCLTAAAETPLELETWSGDPEVNLKIDTRFDGQFNTFGKEPDGTRPKAEKGFKGSYLLLCINGSINSQFGYNFRYRLYKDNGPDSQLFNATDWLYLSYRPDEHWTITGGKEPVKIGTMEYDHNPIDVFFATDFWNHVNPWQMGVSVNYSLSASNTLSLQVTNSTFSERPLDNLLAYNFMWSGHVASWWEVINSVNMIEYASGRYINYIALGNRINATRLATLELDYINRYGGHHTAFFKDFTVAGRLNLNVSDRVTLFGKGGYDQNKAQAADTPLDQALDRCVLPGVERSFYGCGIEYYPLVTRRNKVRLHAYWNSSNDRPRCNSFVVGVRWQMDLLGLKFKQSN